MKFNLIVVEPFGDYAKGDRITDPAAIKAVTDADQMSFVVRAPPQADPPAKAPDPA